jgi:nicotinamide-nucleotide amidase
MRGGKRLKVEIITIGNELISGHILDTNAAFLSDAVFSLGARVTRVVSIGDDREIIAAALREAMTRADLILVTGCLGPTPDDFTPEPAVQVLGRGLYPILFESGYAEERKWSDHLYY